MSVTVSVACVVFYLSPPTASLAGMRLTKGDVVVSCNNDLGN